MNTSGTHHTGSGQVNNGQAGSGWTGDGSVGNGRSGDGPNTNGPNNGARNRKRDDRTEDGGAVLRASKVATGAVQRRTEDARANERARSDVANAACFAEMHAGRVLYDFTMREWFVYDGTRWKQDDANDVQERAKETAAELAERARTNPALARQAKIAGSLSGLRAMLACAASIPTLKVNAREWDADPDLFNLPNGTLDLRTLTLRPHDPADHITKVAGAAYDPDADCPLFKSVLARYFLTRNDPDGHAVELTGTARTEGEIVIRFLGTCFGYRLSARETEKQFLLLHGTGNTGKTTLMRAIKAVWGEYFADAQWDSFARMRDHDGSKHRTDLVKLVGARIVSASEGDEHVRMADGLIKRITGGAQGIEIRQMHGRMFTLRPTFTIVLDTNHLPEFTGHDKAIWNRVMIVFFRNEIAAPERRAFEQAHGSVLQALQREASGILNWAIEGWRRYLADGEIVVPPVILNARTEYREMVDLLGQFLTDRCTLAPDALVPSRDIYERFKEYCVAQGERVPAHNVFTQRMRERGFRPVRTNTVRYIKGIALNTPPSSESSSATGDDAGTVDAVRAALGATNGMSQSGDPF